MTRVQRYIAKGPCSEEWLELCREFPEATSMGDATIGTKRIKAPELLAIVRTKRELKIKAPKGSKIILIFQQGTCFEDCKKTCEPTCDRWQRIGIISRAQIYQT